MSYVRFGLMILTSTVVMFILMYLNTYALEHVFFSETRTYMAILMGAVMAIVMLAFMLGMYKNRSLNIAIFVGALVVFGLSLWLVRSQVTVSGESYMRAMIPHHSIAIMTSKRANIEDPRVRKLADEIIDAQNREVAEMRSMIASLEKGEKAQDIYRDPEPKVGTIGDALNNTLISKLDPDPVTPEQSAQVIADSSTCTFRRDNYENPILVSTSQGEQAVMSLNGVIIPLQGAPGSEPARSFSADGVTMTVRPLGNEGDWRQNAELVFTLDQGLEVGYRGFYSCGA